MRRAARARSRAILPRCCTSRDWRSRPLSSSLGRRLEGGDRRTERGKRVTGKGKDAGYLRGGRRDRGGAPGFGHCGDGLGGRRRADQHRGRCARGLHRLQASLQPLPLLGRRHETGTLDEFNTKYGGAFGAFKDISSPHAGATTSGNSNAWPATTRTGAAGASDLARRALLLVRRRRLARDQPRLQRVEELDIEAARLAPSRLGTAGVQRHVHDRVDP